MKSNGRKIPGHRGKGVSDSPEFPRAATGCNEMTKNTVREKKLRHRREEKVY